jgi:CRP-like cAMP-binding protein
LVAVTVTRDYPADVVVCHEGKLEHVFHIIQEGQVAITHRLPDGSEQRLGVQGAGSFFGEIALLENQPRSASVRTLVESRLLEITGEDFKRVVRGSPEAALTVLRGLIQSLRETDRVTIAQLQENNLELAEAYADLKAAQARLVEQERLERELEIAAEVQRSILPAEFPDFHGFEFAAYARPAREVGGDYYDLFPLDDDHFGLVMADVSGKSVHAALYMAVTRALFLAKAAEYRSPRDAAFQIHDLLMTSSDSDLFVTVFYGIVNRVTLTSYPCCKPQVVSWVVWMGWYWTKRRSSWPLATSWFVTVTALQTPNPRVGVATAWNGSKRWWRACQISRPRPRPRRSSPTSRPSGPALPNLTI